MIIKFAFDNVLVHHFRLNEIRICELKHQFSRSWFRIDIEFWYCNRSRFRLNVLDVKWVSYMSQRFSNFYDRYRFRRVRRYFQIQIVNASNIELLSEVSCHIFSNCIRSKSSFCWKKSLNKELSRRHIETILRLDINQKSRFLR